MGNLTEYKRLNLRKACTFQFCGRATPEPPGEEWPFSEDGAMALVCELNLTSAPVAPELMQGLATIRLFVNLEAGDWGEANGMDWVLRAYRVQPIDALAGSRWKAVDDYPSLDAPGRTLPEGFDDAEVEVESIQRSKIGGWPSNIESPQWWEMEDHPAVPQYCFQVVSDEKTGLEFGEGGILYLARGTAPGYANEWFLDWQSY